MKDRFERQRALFGDEGQERISRSRVAIVGAGGLGSFVAMELAYLGVGHIAIIDRDRLELSNRNRLVGAWSTHADGEPKVSIAEQLVKLIDPSITVSAIAGHFPEVDASAAVARADYVIGCLDRDGARLELNEFVCRNDLPLLDAASDTLRDGGELAYGGRVCSVRRENGCLVCLGVIDPRRVQDDLASPQQKEDAAAIYGVNRAALAGTGPSVVTVNGVIASLAATEFMADVAGLRHPFSHLEYQGHRGVVLRSRDQQDSQCYFCSLRGDAGTT